MSGSSRNEMVSGRQLVTNEAEPAGFFFIDIEKECYYYRNAPDNPPFVLII